jgi:hypothetical protein
MRTRILLAFTICLLLIHARGLWAQPGRDGDKGPENFTRRPAVFEVTTDVVNPDLEAFTVTAGSFGNSLLLRQAGAFEPANYRTRFWALKDSADRLYVNNLDGWGSWASGYLDGADVRVYRAIDGKLELVRRDRVPEGGTVVEAWDANTSKPLKPDVTEYQFTWSEYGREGTTSWFTVHAIDKSGNLSAPATPIRFVRPDGTHETRVKNATFRFRPRRRNRDNEAPPAPTNLRAVLKDNNVLHLTWAPVKADDLAGYVFARSDVDPARHRGQYIELSSKPSAPREHIREGDMIIVSKVFRAPDYRFRSAKRARQTRGAPLPDLLGFFPQTRKDVDWRLVDHEPDTPVSQPGQTYLELKLADGASHDLASRSLDDTQQGWYNVPHAMDYTAEVWLKADRADAAEVTFKAEGGGNVDEIVPPTTFQPTTRWKKFTYKFRAKTPDNIQPSFLLLGFQGPATYSVDNFRVYRSDTAYLDYLPERYEQLKRSGMAAFRTHGPIKTGSSTYSMEQFTNPPGVLTGVKLGNTLPQQLAMMEKAGVHPWLQIEFHMSAEEWLGFVEFIAAPYDPNVDSPKTKPWAFKRFRQGRTEPWTDAFERIYFELSNETWNWMFQPWVFEGMPDAATGQKLPRGQIYGMMNEHIVEILRSSPYWNDEIEEKFVYVIGGWSRSTYGWDAVAGSPSADFQTIAAYNGGWDEGEGPPQVNPASFFNVLGQVYQSAVPTARLNARRALEKRKAGHAIRLGTYEAGPGYALNGLNGARVSAEQAKQQEEVMKSKVGGTATLDSFLMRAKYDFDLQNFFTFSEGRTWSSHAEWYNGHQSYPCFLTLELFNRQGLGDLLAVKTHSVSTVDTAGRRRRKAIENAPLAAVYATRSGRRVNVFCISRMFPGYPESSDDGNMPMTLKLPFSRASKVTLYRMTGKPTDHNIDRQRVKIESVEIGKDMTDLSEFRIDQATGAGPRGLGPGETYLYVFEGTDIGAPGRDIPLEETLAKPVSFEPSDG